MARRAIGEGTIYKRKDGRYEGAAFFRTVAGARKRFSVYGKTREEAHAKLVEAQARAHRGNPIPDKSWKLAAYLDYWLEHIVRPSLSPKTYEHYEVATRLYLKPALGTKLLTRLNVPMVQTYLNQQLEAGCSVRRVQIIRKTLSSALTRAMKEELVTRNVARLVELPSYEPAEVKPWSGDEVSKFLSAIVDHRWYPIFLLLLMYGLRRGEVLGLRWQDIDFEEGEIHVRQQLQRVGRELLHRQLKTRASRRDLPMLDVVRQTLLVHQARQTKIHASASESSAVSDDDFVFTTDVYTPIEPRNLVRTYWQLCDQAGVRVIKLHHLRHTAATLLKKLGVPARDAQLILGHSQISVTQQIYQHDDIDSRRDALDRVANFVFGDGQVVTQRTSSSQLPPSNNDFSGNFSAMTSGDLRLRTCGKPSLKRSNRGRWSDQVASVQSVMRARTRRWVLGLTAVSGCRQNPDPAEGLCPCCGALIQVTQEASNNGGLILEHLDDTGDEQEVAE
ncbi:tyrosine-type recombinase/integrase [Fodinicola acaciae]|uniref:tyrosine-type recombinase/integrase n=1 Tax=Fodinicola acaciae TaxID=2681555 RepID=UPI0013D0489A|nr:site-specific integrase [Fodinicola acaciae]